MFLKQNIFQRFLEANKHNAEIYDAMAIDDLSEVVMTTLNVLRRINALPLTYKIKIKSVEISTAHRIKGNEAYKNGIYQIALACYNEALLYAPKCSIEMILAYSNRSALLYKLQMWTACKNDIDRCLAINGCPTEIFEKLSKRKRAIKDFWVPMEGFNSIVKTGAAEKCINYHAMTQNSQIPCASSDVEVMVSNMSIVASRDIKAGTVIASESAYVSYTEPMSRKFSCHFCQKKSLNLIPCDDCCYALFCNEDCRNECIIKYHKYECKIIDVMCDLQLNPKQNLMVKACLKLKTACKSWKEFITASHNTGFGRIQSSSINEIFDSNQIYSILTFRDDKPFIYGPLYNSSFIIAALLHHLEERIPSFLPKDTIEKEQALRAIGRIMMFLVLYQEPLHIMQAQVNVKLGLSGYGKENYGLYSFIGKLNRVCNPNSIVINNNNNLVLLTLYPIKHGEKLTVSYFWHKVEEYDEKIQSRYKLLYYGTVCNCSECSNDSSQNHNNQLSKSQKKYISQLNMTKLNENLIKRIEVISVYHTLLKALEVLKDVPKSKEYLEIFKHFQKCILFIETANSDNHVLDEYF